MTFHRTRIQLPELPSPEDIADVSREVAATERVQPWSVEKDLYLTRLIWALAQVHGDGLLLKGGTCLSKCDLGYHRMSEDADFVIPGQPTRYRVANTRQLNPVPRSLREIGDDVGMNLTTFDGERFETQSHGLWEMTYQSILLPPRAAALVVEAAIRPTLLPPRRVALRQLVPADLMPGYDKAYCWALDYLEVRAEKIRAALTREEPEVRDFYDLALFAAAEVDMASEEFVDVLNVKLAEVDAPPLADQPASFGLTGERRVLVEAGRTRLVGVVRIDEPRFDLDSVLEHYNRLWGKR
jgi:predicted nucleotidyltransferase component of viral defense system